MAAQPPTGPMPSNDGSSIFRRAKSKAPARPSPDHLNPDEPADLIDIDPESVPLDEMPGSSPPRAERIGSDVVAEEVVFADDDEVLDVPGDSSVKLDTNIKPTAAGSGWFEDGVEAAPPTGKYDDAAQLFADLSGEVPDSTTNWVKKSQGTGRVSENELLQAFNDASREFDDNPSEHEMDRPDSEDNPRSSIFGKVPDQASGVDLDEIRLMGSSDSGMISDLYDDLPPGGSSIFERSGRMTQPDEEEAGRFGFELPEPVDPTGASQASGRINLDDPGFVEDDTAPNRPLSSLADLDLDSTEAAQSTGAMKHAATTPMPVRPPRSEDRKPIEPKRAAPVPDEDEPAGKLSKGLGKFVGGAAFGLLAAGVTFAGLYLGGVIPNERKETAPVAKVSSADPDAVAKLGELQKQFDEAKQLATSQKQEFDKQLAAEKKDAADAKKKLADGQTELKEAIGKFENDADKLRKSRIEADQKLETATTELTAAKKDASTFKTEMESAKKDAGSLKTELDTTKKAAETAMMAVEGKRKAAEDTLAGVVTELKSAKLLGPNDDASKIPAAVKQFAAVANTGDAQKAAEALLSARKEADTLKANLKTATDDAAKAKDEIAAARTAADKIKTDADKALAAMKTEGEKALADAKKSVDDKVKTAVDAATKDSTAALAKAQKEIETAKTTAKLDAETAAKKQIDEAMAKANAAETARMADKTVYEQKLAEQAALFAARMSEAKSGATVQVTSAESAAAEKASRSYASGLSAFEAGRLIDAEALFNTAATSNSGDARYWYFLGLSQHSQGKSKEAEAAFRKGAELESRGKPTSRLVSEAFERLPLSLRGVVKVFRP